MVKLKNLKSKKCPICGKKCYEGFEHGVKSLLELKKFKDVKIRWIGMPQTTEITRLIMHSCEIDI